jgi:DNA recombination protein RmuC
MTTAQIALLLGGFLAGFVLAWVMARSRLGKKARDLEAALVGRTSVETEIRRQLNDLQSRLEVANSKTEQEQQKRVRAETDSANQATAFEERRRLLDDAEQKMKDAFQSLAAQALETNNQQFLDLAGTRFQTLREEASGELGKRSEEIKGWVNPLRQTLEILNQRLSEVESSRQQAYGTLTEQVRGLNETSEALRRETGSLVTSLRQPQIKGKWGEMLLRRALELAGMSPYCDFDEQPSMDTEEGRLRPDLVVKIPGGGIIVIDAKVPQGAFLNALSARNQDEYWTAMSEHARLVRNHVAQLSSRKYWDQFPSSPEFVVLFLPAESFFSAALERDHTLIEDAMNKRVVLASPTTLLALLLTVAHGWRQERIAESAQQISDLGKDLYEKIRTFLDHIEGIRSGLERANKAYNSAVGSLEGRLLPSARKFRTMGIKSSEEIPSAEPTETALRSLTALPPEDSG